MVYPALAIFTITQSPFEQHAFACIFHGSVSNICVSVRKNDCDKMLCVTSIMSLKAVNVFNIEKSGNCVLCHC